MERVTLFSDVGYIFWCVSFESVAFVTGDCILEADPQKVQLDQQVRLAAMDQTVKPNMLLFLQAGMPFPPSEASQHTLQVGFAPCE